RLNHLHPPFNDVRARRAILMALSQEDYMRAAFGDDNETWKLMPSFFTPGTPLYNEDGAELLKGRRNLDAAKKLLSQSGYSGEPVICLLAQDLPFVKAWGEVTLDLLKRLGVNADGVATDWATVVARRAQKAPPGKGGWHLFHGWGVGADFVSPATNRYVRANGNDAWFGWPNIPQVEVGIDAWFNAKSLDEEKVAARAVNKAALDEVVCAPLGQFFTYQAWRKNITGIVKGPLPFFWGVSKTV